MHFKKKDYIQAEDLFNHLNFEPDGSLIAAINNNSLILAQYFVEQKEADVNFNCFGSNLLDVAAKLEEPHKTEITDYLSKKRAEILNTTLEEAAQDGNIKKLKKLLNIGKEINDNKNESPLMLAAQNGHVEG